MTKQIDNYFDQCYLIIKKEFNLEPSSDVCEKDFVETKSEFRDIFHDHPDIEFIPMVGYDLQKIVLSIPNEISDLFPDTFSIITQNRALMFFELPPHVESLDLPDGVRNLIENPGSLMQQSREFRCVSVKELPLKFIEFKENKRDEMIDNIKLSNASFTMIDQKWKSIFPEIRPSEERLLIYLIRETRGRYIKQQDRTKEWIKISYSNIADRMNMSKSTVLRNINDLEDKGLIKVEGVSRSKLSFKIP